MKLNIKRTLFIGMAFLSISAFWQLYDIIIPLILENTFEMNKTNTGIVMSLDNIIALFLLPILGSWSDKIKTPLGKRTPFIIIGTIIAIIGMILIPISSNNYDYTLFRISLTIVLLGTALYRSPAVALMPDLTVKALRSKANAIINLMGAFGGVLTLISIKILVKRIDGTHPDYFPLFLTISILMFISILILKIKINENKLLEEMPLDNSEDTVRDKNNKMDPKIFKSLFFILTSIFLWFTAYNGVITAFSRYAINVWNMNEGSVAISVMIANLFAIISFIPAGQISFKIGRKNTILIGISLVSLAYLLGIFLTKFSFVIYIVFGIMGTGWAMINVNSFPMVVEMSKNSDIGKYTGMYYTASMLAQIITPIFSGFLMDQIGYSVLFPYALIFSILSFVSMIFVKYGNAKEKIDNLEIFGIED